jgi:uncharacterized protein YcbK (DUF882 family)
MVTRRTWAFVLLGVLVAASGAPSGASIVPQGVGEPRRVVPAISSALASLEIPTQPVTFVLRNANLVTEELIVTIGRDGTTDPATEALLAEFFRCRRSGRSKAMDHGVLAFLAEIGARWPGHAVEVVSAYRSPPYGVPHSRHFKGRAIDLRVEGIPLAEVRDVMWGQHQGIGVGYYPSQRFLHIDSREIGEDSAWSSRHEGAAYHYNPSWSVKARAQHPALVENAPQQLAAAVAQVSPWSRVVTWLVGSLLQREGEMISSGRSAPVQ